MISDITLSENTPAISLIISVSFQWRHQNDCYCEIEIIVKLFRSSVRFTSQTPVFPCVISRKEKKILHFKNSDRKYTKKKGMHHTGTIKTWRAPHDIFFCKSTYLH